MKSLKIFAFFALFLVFPAQAQVPPAEQLLPDDTVAVFSIPDWTKLSAYYKQSPYSQLWADPAMKAFKEKFLTKFKADVTEPLERELGGKLADYKDLLQGQLTVALTPPREGTPDPVGLLIMLDAKDKSEQLKTRLADLKKKWTDSGKETKTEKIRDTEFSVVSISEEDWKKLTSKVFPKADAAEAQDKEEQEKKEPLQLHIGQHKSLLLIGENPKSLEKIIARQSGGIVPTLGEQAAFQKNYGSKFRDSLGYGWLHFKPIYQMIVKRLAESEEAPPEGMPDPRKIMPALGFEGLETLGLSMSGNNDGGQAEFFIGVPEARREGLFKILALEKKDSSPPPFIPADVVKFQRWRLNVQNAWSAIEATIGKIDPNISAMVLGMINQVGKEKDPNFDFKKNFIGNVGDDLISMEKLPKNAKAEELASPPSLFLVSSPNASEMIETFKTLALLLPPPIGGEPPKEREFLGKKIYTLSATVPVPDPSGDENKEPVEKTQELNFATSGGYLAFSAESAMLEEYLRSSESGAKPLRDTPGLNEAAQKIGGLESGFFGFENQKETMRHALEVIKQDKEGFESLFFPMQFNLDLQGAQEAGEKDKKEGLRSWFDYTLLPNYDAVAKYFHIAVYNGTATPEGFSFKFYGPTPPQLKK